MDGLIRGLLCPEAYDHPVTGLRLLETHISWVILTGVWAYKLKKPVDLGFANFTTLDRRRHFCEEEIRLNRRLAPELYRGVRPLFGTREIPTFCGTGEPLEYAVQMRQFDQHQLLPAVLKRNELRPEHLDMLADTIAVFHRQAAVAHGDAPFGTAAAVRDAARDNIAALDRAGCDRTTLSQLRGWSELEFQRRKIWFDQRRGNGHVRECHGDMHLGNMVLQDDAVCIFDCLEFNPELRWTDVIAEIAFLVMDLQERGRRDLALRLLNRWLEQTGDYEGLTGWRWYFVYRALVRAKVAALRLQQADLETVDKAAKQDELRTYLALAKAWTESRPKTVLLMHGLSGSGKSHVSAQVCEAWPVIRLRSDVERKRLFGRWGDPRPTRLTGDPYAADVTAQVYREILARHIPTILEAGFSVVIDAACLESWERHLFREIATQEGAQFVILDVQARPATLRQRIVQRHVARRDASDADLAVLEHQLAHHEPLSLQEQQESITVDTESPSWWDFLAARLVIN
jgi:aminoglycoside phosphotransferase family enzyme